jgi:lipopolysaccharide export system protein LptA
MCHYSNKRALLLGMLLMGQICVAHAEKADRDKPLHLESDRLNLDNTNHVSIFEGKVELTQGTLRVLAEKIVVTEDASGHKFCVATGHLASFRQKRDAVNEYVEGYGERIEYDTLNEKIDFFVRARVKRDQDDVRGDHITYNTQTEIFRVSSPEKTGRVRATLQPKSKDNQSLAPKVAEPKELESKGAESKHVESKSVEPKPSELIPAPKLPGN